MLLFSYGSNSPRQLAERLGHEVIAGAAFVKGYQRVFRGWSQKWKGGVASLAKMGGAVTYGGAAQVDEDDIAILDQYEGIGTGHYRRREVIVHLTDGSRRKAIAYVSCSKEHNVPSRAYLEACAENVGSFWDDVTWLDFPIR